MSTYTQILYQIVFSTKLRERTLIKEERPELFKDIKLRSSSFIKEKGIFPQFGGWQEGYAAFTYHISAKDNLIEYVKNQEIHHVKKSFRDELKEMLHEHGVQYNEKYLN